MGCKGSSYGILVRKPEDKGVLENLGVDGRIRKQSVRYELDLSCLG